jgi:hypothetical protein
MKGLREYEELKRVYTTTAIIVAKEGDKSANLIRDIATVCRQQGQYTKLKLIWQKKTALTD